MKCGICETQESKYKCPSCRLVYCSLNCWKEHQKIKCESVSLPNNTEEEIRIGSQKYEHQTEDTVPLDRLKLLENSKVLQQILQNPHLQELLVSVDRSPNPDRAMQLAMQEPLFVEFADECLKIIEPVEDASTVPT
ncbi:Zinc finger HIT domain-containing protein 3 [Cryptotermes secundus]|uniref:Zinc finger HIT domain-containing protein 3 n=1 Tax=Cryptotermes secundus TaxID=105785 RepID=A0A2J7QP24_9NEOP|nr:zinc finger HIT domain-containing protein 3 isoform X4 [Cryptotermes secundus]PNF30340.1 Zinc finger HIT domain-containing protein 3 [Cryptotermes secundus]